MNSVQRAVKKMTIVLILLTIIGVIVYFLTKPKTPQCFNGVLDPGENGVDCGGFCAKQCPIPDKPDYVKDVKVNWVQFVEDGRNNYDFVASLSNDNEKWGVKTATYDFIYFDDGGNEIGRKTGTLSIAPRGATSEGSLKYVIEDDVKSNIKPARVDFNLSKFDWEEVSDAENLNENVIEISNKKLEMNQDLKMYVVSGTTKNTSTYDFKFVNINTVLFGQDGKVVAAGKTDQHTMIAGDGWGFQILFPNLKSKLSDVAKIDLRAETDVYDKNNFMKEYKAQE